MERTMLTVIVGLPGTGKTTFASALAAATDAHHLNSDIVRHTLGKQGMYDANSKAAVYQELFDRTENFLADHQRVVLDATFYKEILREPYRQLGEKYDITTRWIELRADEEEVKKRVSKKRAYTEADFEVYQKIKASYEPFESAHLVLWSDQLAGSEMVEKALEYLTINQATS